MNSPWRALAIFKFKRKLSRTARTRFKKKSEKDQDLLVDVMEEGPRSLGVANEFLEKGLEDVKVIHKPIVKRDDEDVPIEIAEEIVKNEVSPVLGNVIVNKIPKDITADTAEEIIEKVGDRKDIGPAQQVEIARELIDCEKPEDVEEVIEKMDNPKKYFNDYQESIDEYERKKKEQQQAST